MTKYFASEAEVMRAIMAMVGPYRARNCVVMGFAALSAALFTFVSLAVGRVAEAALHENWDQAAIGVAVIFVVTALVILLKASSNIQAHKIAAQVQKNLRQQTAARLRIISMGAFHEIAPEDLRALVVEDIETLEDGVAHLPPELAAGYAGPLVMFVTMLFVDWRLTIAAIVPLVLGVIIMVKVMRGSEQATQALHSAQGRMLSSMAEIFQALPVVKTYNNADAATSRATAAMEDFDHIVRDWSERSLPPSNLFFILTGSGLTVLTPISLWLLEQGSVDLEQVVFFHAGALSLSLIVSTMFGLAARMRQQGRVVARRNDFMAFPVLDYSSIDAPQSGTCLRFDGVCFSQDGHNILRNINFDLPEGQSLALVGPSGAGKSTLAKLIARFWDVSQGEITIGGANIRAMPAKQLARNVAFVFQDNFLFSRSIADNLRITKPDATLSEIKAAARTAQADEFIQNLPDGYDTVLTKALRLSGGQKQRICIARAILQDAPVLVLDEAMAFIDPESEALVQKAIKALRKGRTTIVIAHRLHTIRDADHIIYLENGQIAERGSHTNLMALKGGYAGQWDKYREAQTHGLGLGAVEKE